MSGALGRVARALGADAALVAVGGCVRDRLLGRGQDDWDLATALLPDEVLRRATAAGLRALPTGLQHGTVTILAEGHPFEITTFRGDGAYSDGRHPDTVILGVGLHEDLARRDFTLNAMALPVGRVGDPNWADHVVDPFGGRDDLAKGLLRAVGDPLARFGEDGLRPFRACRFAAQLGFTVEPATLAAIPRRLEVAAKVAAERVATELTKLLLGVHAPQGLRLLEATGLLDLWLPELRPMVGCAQNRHHRLDVWEHTLEVIRCAPRDPALRWAALLHDVGKPATRTLDAAGEAHFYDHERASEALAIRILQRLKGSRQLQDQVAALVRHHGAHPDPAWGDAACRRLLRRLQQHGLTLERWASFRLADLQGKGFGPDHQAEEHAAVVARLSALAAQRPPLEVKALALDGQALMTLAGRRGGPWLGELQRHLLEQVIEAPGANSPAVLETEARRWLLAREEAPPA